MKKIDEYSKSSSPERVSFFNSLGLLLILNILVKPVWIFGIDRKVQLETGQAEFGSYFSLLNLSIVFSFLMDLGFTSYFNRQLAYHKEGFTRFTGNFLLLKILLSFVYALVIFFVAWICGIRETGIIISLIMVQVLTSLFLFFRSIITAHQWFRTDAWLSVLDKTLLILVCGSILYFPLVFETISIEKFLVLQIACTGLAAFSALGILLRRGIVFHISPPLFFPKILFRDAIPFGILLFLMGMHYRLDGFLLERLRGPGEAGLYAAAYRLLDAANMAGWLVASFLLPYLSRLWAGSKEIDSVVLRARHLLLTYSVFIVTAAVILAPWLSGLLYENKIENASMIISLALPALMGYSLVQIYGTVLTATGHIRSFCMIILCAVALNLILNFIFIPSYGVEAACWSAIASHGFAGITCMIYCRQKLELPIHYRSIFIYFFSAAILCLLFLTGKNLLLSDWALLGAGGIISWLFLLLLIPGAWKYWLRLKTSVT